MKIQATDACRRRWLALTTALVLGCPAALRAQPASPPFDLAALMAMLAQRKGGEARFTEERTVSSLDVPLRASGRLSFQAPDRFARYTEVPTRESMEVQGNQVVLKRGSRTRQMTLDASPELAALAEAMRGTLNGDGPALQRHFHIQVSGNAARWVLLLKPQDARLSRSVVQLEMTGLGPDVRSIDLLLVGGDRSSMRVESLAPSSANAVDTPAPVSLQPPAAK